MQYGQVGVFNAGFASIFGVVGSPNTRGLYSPPNPFSCCGITTLAGFGVLSLTSFKERAAFLSGLFRLYHKTHLVYVLNEGQVRQAQEHQALLALGAIQVCEFPNLQPHHGNQLYMFAVNLNDGIGKFFDAQGMPFETAPKEPAAPRPKTVVVKEPKAKAV